MTYMTYSTVRIWRIYSTFSESLLFIDTSMYQLKSKWLVIYSYSSNQVMLNFETRY